LNKRNLNAISLSFLPIIVIIPISINILKNLHLGGINLVSEFLFSALLPKLNSAILISLISRINETIFIALTSWFLSILFGIFFGLLSSDILYEIINLPLVLGRLIKLFLILIRSIHELVWGLLLMQIYGINISVGIISICIPYVAINAKVINEQLENIEPKVIKSILEINGNKFSSLITLVWHPILKTLQNFGFYRLECALRSTAILGLFGLGGLGTSIYLSFKALSFRELWTYLWSLGILIIFSKIIIKHAFLKNFNSKLRVIIFIGSLILSICSLIYFFNFLSNPSYLFNYSLKNLYDLKNNFISYSLIKLIYETILLCILATAIAVSLPPFLSIIFNNRLGNLLMNGLAFCFRLIPPPITILILIMFNEPSISLAALSLGLYNAGITFKLLNSNLNNLERSQFLALNSIGAPKRISWLYGLFAKQAKSYLAYCSYRSDILIRETAIVGVVGSIGLGWQLQESISSFAWEEVSIVLLAYSLIVIIGEIINDKIKNNFI